MKKLAKYTLTLLAMGAIAYGSSRLYYATTAGFLVSNITSSLAYDPRWETHPLSSKERSNIETALNQEYSYLGKGCQSYVFESQDGKYVIKFLKYQRFRPQEWIDLFTFIPSIHDYQIEKGQEKKLKLDKVFRSWKIAYESLQKETGVVYVHLNKSKDWDKQVTIKDKLGMRHQINIDQTEFLLQRKASMFCPYITSLMQENHQDKAEILIDKLLEMLLAEYTSGFADNDHALMQNTGVLEGNPVHIDAGQFIRNPIVQNPEIFKKEIYDKTYKLHQWLQKNHPSLAEHLRNRLLALVDLDYYYWGPYQHKGDVAKIPHEE